MKKKDINELKNKSIDQLKKMVVQTEAEIVKAKVQNEQEKTKNVHMLRAKRKDIARFMTLLNFKNLVEKNTKSEKGVKDAAK